MEQLSFCKEINCDAVAIIPLYPIVLAKFKSMNLPTYKPERDTIIVCLDRDDVGGCRKCGNSVGFFRSCGVQLLVIV